MGNLQRQRDTLQDIIERIKSGKMQNIDREAFIEFAEQMLELTDTMLAAIDELSQ